MKIKCEGTIVFDSFAQREINGKLQDDELQAIKARKQASTASSSDLQKLKKHKKILIKEGQDKVKIRNDEFYSKKYRKAYIYRS